MDISEFAFNLLLIFFPGIICAYMVDMFTNHAKRTPFQFSVNVFLLGFGSYLIYYFFAGVFSCLDGRGSFLYCLSALPERLEDPSTREIINNITLWQIILASVISVLLAVLLICINTYKLHFKLLQGLGITRKFGEIDVWGLLMNSRGTEWLTVRDMENDLMYQGWVKAYSDSSEAAELLLEAVIVYNNSTGKELYEVDAQYLSLDRGRIAIEAKLNTGDDHDR